MDHDTRVRVQVVTRMKPPHVEIIDYKYSTLDKSDNYEN